MLWISMSYYNHTPVIETEKAKEIRNARLKSDGAINRAGVHGTGEAKLGCVGELNRLSNVQERNDRGNQTEGLVTRHRHLVRDIRMDGGCND